MILATVNVTVLMRHIGRVIQAELDDSWKGGGDPDDHEEIEAELEDARTDLAKYLEEKRV